MNSVTKIAVGSLLVCGTFAYAQAPSSAAASDSSMATSANVLQAESSKSAPATPATNSIIEKSPAPAGSTSAGSASAGSASAGSASTGSASAGSASTGSATAGSATAPDAASSADSSIKPLPADAPEPDPDILVDPASLIPDLPRVPGARATLIGGTVERLDRVRDQVTVRVFGGGKMNILFDPRTRVYKGKEEATIADLHEGERAYLDTILDGNKIFARTIRLKAVQAVGESQGVVVRYRVERGELTFRDAISPAPVRVTLTSATRFTQGDKTVASTALLEGSLVAIKFSSEKGGHDVAREISILALPGARYIFAGQVMHIDLRTGLLVINSSTDGKTYEVYLDTSAPPDDNLHVGSIVTVSADFQDSRYLARSVKIISQGQ